MKQSLRTKVYHTFTDFLKAYKNISRKYDISEAWLHVIYEMLAFIENKN